MTAQIFTVQSRLNALAALLNVRKADAALIKRVNIFSNDVRDAQDARNRIVHDAWFKDNNDPEAMGKLQITADKKLKFRIESMKIEALNVDTRKIHTRKIEFEAIRKSIYDALPSLPEIPQAELHPIYETH